MTENEMPEKNSRASIKSGDVHAVRSKNSFITEKVFRAEWQEIRKRRRREDGQPEKLESLDVFVPEGEDKKEWAPSEPSVGYGLVGLALSGGGIRSATFNLGVLQELEDKGILRRVDYLSTVSGGGFIGSCLDSVYATNWTSPFPFKHRTGVVEGRAMTHLREYSNYLAPKGFWDLLRAPALALRGIVINFLIVLPFVLVAAFAMAKVSGEHVAKMSQIITKTAKEKEITDKRLEVAKAALKTAASTKKTAEAKRKDAATALKIAQKKADHATTAKARDGARLAVDKAEEKLGDANDKLDQATDDSTSASEFVDKLSKESKKASALAEGLTPWSMVSIFSMAVSDRRAFAGGTPQAPPMGLKKLRSFWITLTMLAILGVVCAIYPLVQYFVHTEWSGRDRATRVLGFLLGLVAVAAIIELQPVALLLFHRPPVWLKEIVDVKSQNSLTLWTAIVALVGAVFSGKLMQQAQALAGALGRMDAWKNISAKLGLYAIAVVAPLAFWLIFLDLSLWAVFWEEERAPGWVLGIGEWISSNVGGFHWLFPGVSFSSANNGDQVLIVFWALAIILFLYSWIFFDINRTSLHNFYRDRLSKAYLFGPEPSSADEMQNNDKQSLHGLHENGGPYHLMGAALNIQRSETANLRGRNAEFFIFSKRFIGSELTDYCPTKDVEEIFDPHVDLGTAMSVSGAAAAPNMGRKTIRPLTFLMTFLNIRLGYWLPNPGRMISRSHWKFSESNKFVRESGTLVARASARTFGRVGPFYLIWEMFGHLNDKSLFVNLSDGGHLENLGIYELLRRRCKFIIASDAESDPGYEFDGLAHVIRLARIDMGIHIRIDVEGISREKGEVAYAMGIIEYGEGKENMGLLLYIKPSLVGGEVEYISRYARESDTFPQETTGDQFFDEAQFEAYRALGRHVANLAINSPERDEVSPLKDAPDGSIANGKAWFERLRQETTASG